MKKEKCIKLDSAVNALAKHLLRDVLTEGYEASDNTEDWKPLAKHILEPAIKESSTPDKWIVSFADNGWNDWKCPKCGYIENIDVHVDLNWNFCPNCGTHLT